jgi:putative chitinase
MLTASVLTNVYGRKDAALWLPHMQAALDLAECSTKQQVAAFIAQIGHETGCLRYTKEIWGPTPQQLRYEPDTKLSEVLGNNRPGDGKRYMGRGLIQTTGRANYRMTRDRLRAVLPDVPDFEVQPELLEQKRWAALSAGLFWKVKRLNNFVDNYAEMTRRINGGYNGLAHRQALLAQALGEMSC